MTVRRRAKTKRLPWRVAPPSVREITTEKKAAAPPEAPRPPKKQWPKDFIETKG